MDKSSASMEEKTDSMDKSVACMAEERTKRRTIVKKDLDSEKSVCKKSSKAVIEKMPIATIDDFTQKELMDLINYCFANNVNPIHYLAENRNISLLKYLLASDMLYPIDVVDIERDTPLLAALKYKNYATAYELIKYGANVNAQDIMGYTPLMITLADEHLSSSLKSKFIKKLLDNDADVNLQTYIYKHTIFMTLFVADNYDLTKQILEHKNVKKMVNLNMKNADNETVLQYIEEDSFIEEEDSIKYAKLYIKYGADINIGGDDKTPLYNAIISSKYELMKHLLSYDDININNTDSTGETNLHNAISFKDIKAVTLLLSHKNINVNIQDKYGYTPLHHAIKERHRPIFNLLLAREDLNISLCARFIGTPLIYVIGDADTNKYMLDRIMKYGTNSTTTPWPNSYSILDNKDKWKFNPYHELECAVECNIEEKNLLLLIKLFGISCLESYKDVESILTMKVTDTKRRALIDIIQQKSDEVEVDCPICYDTTMRKHFVIGKCHHHICASCYSKSIRSNGYKELKCPMCRGHFTRDDDGSSTISGDTQRAARRIQHRQRAMEHVRRLLHRPRRTATATAPAAPSSDSDSDSDSDSGADSVVAMLTASPNIRRSNTNIRWLVSNPNFTASDSSDSDADEFTLERVMFGAAASGSGASASGSGASGSGASGSGAAAADSGAADSGASGSGAAAS